MQGPYGRICCVISILLSWGRTGCTGGKWCVHNASWLVRMDEVRTWVCRQWQTLSSCQTTLPRSCHTAHARVQFILERVPQQVQSDTSRHVPFQPSHNFPFVYFRTPLMPVTSLAREFGNEITAQIMHVALWWTQGWCTEKMVLVLKKLFNWYCKVFKCFKGTLKYISGYWLLHF